MTSKKIDIDESLFDSWTDEQDQQALEAAAEAFDVKVITVENSIAGRFPDGFIAKLSLGFDVTTIRGLAERFEDPVDQLIELFSSVSTKAESEKLVKQPFPSLLKFTSAYFDRLERLAGISLGK